MNVLLRRISVLSAGIAVLAIEGMASKPARAGGFTSSLSACTQAGGTANFNTKEKKYWCETPQRDSECQRRMPRYDKKGEPLEWFYNVNTRKCEEECFLTTACVGHLGLADDCFELSVLRRFRDTFLAQSAGGPEDIALYYRHAPAIVQRIRESETPERELARLYARYVLPSALAARFGLHRLARQIYSSMMRELADRYDVALG